MLPLEKHRLAESFSSAVLKLNVIAILAVRFDGVDSLATGALFVFFSLLMSIAELSLSVVRRQKFNGIFAFDFGGVVLMSLVHYLRYIR